MPCGMKGHVGSVFKHACISVPVDPLSKLPLAEFERTEMYRGTKKKQKKKYSIDSSSTDSALQNCNDILDASKFYKKIPDYSDFTELSNQELYSTLNYLRKKRRPWLCYPADVTRLYENIISDSVVDKVRARPFQWNDWYIDDLTAREKRRQMLGCYSDVREVDDIIKRKSLLDKFGRTDFLRNNWYIEEMEAREKRRQMLEDSDEFTKDLRQHFLVDKVIKLDEIENHWKFDYEDDIKARKSKYNSELKCKYDAEDSEKERDKRCCSYDSRFKKITDDIDTILNDDVITTNKTEEEEPPDQKLENCDVLSSVTNKPNVSSETKSKRINSACSITWDDKVVVNNCDDDIDSKFKKYFPSSTPSPSNLRKCISLPSSPTKVRKSLFPEYKPTSPKPFKMTMRDEDHQKAENLKYLTKSFSEEMLDRKLERKRFRANPVPIESRIPLYDKIVQEQELRRAITKINSMMDLHAQMKPFSFTKRDDIRNSKPCWRSKQLSASTDTTKKKKKFRAKPVPKNLFSNYIYDKMREDDIYRTLNRRIRAEELLRSASLPPNMLSRERAAAAGAGVHAYGGRARRRLRQRNNGHLITTCPQPFHFDTATRAKKKEALKKIYQDRSTSVPSPVGITRPLPALDISSVNRSNLAAILRIETAKKKLEEDIQRKLVEQQFHIEMRWRDHILRKRPAWLRIKNNHEEELALRLQARREEDRLRRELFLHEMELMYGRVQRQPLLFERHYEPPSRHRHSYSSQCSDIGRLSPTKRQTRKNKSQSSLGPSSSTSRKVSINETAEMINEDMFNYLDLNNVEEKTLYGSYLSPHSGGELSGKKHCE